MRDLKTFNQWMSAHGVKWAEGQEQMVKSAAMDQTEAENLIRDYYNQGFLVEKEPTI